MRMKFKNMIGWRRRIVLAMATAVLIAAVAAPASAGTPGSKSQAGTGIWMVDYTERGDCSNNSVNTSDNVITGDSGVVGVWVKSAELVANASAFSLTFEFYGKGTLIDYEYLIPWGDISCGVYRLYRTNFVPAATGSITMKVLAGGKVFGYDTARFGS